MEFFVPGQLKNPLNGSWGHWRKHARLYGDWRNRTYSLMFGHFTGKMTPAWLIADKRVTFEAHVGRLWDDDNLPAAIKPIRDAVAEYCCRGGDGPKSGNEFVYRQKVATPRGVTITVEAL